MPEVNSRYRSGRHGQSGLRVHTAAKLPDPFTFNGVTLACSRAYESAMTRTVELYPRSYNILKSLYTDHFKWKGFTTLRSSPSASESIQASLNLRNRQEARQ
ncbi:hypothetical protein BDZ97DRAFT_623155 [Flammula alnicola]|nr:hypothetical protein BDZ97DRAFT_623155 [Flammula alnicola]